MIYLYILRIRMMLEEIVIVDIIAEVGVMIETEIDMGVVVVEITVIVIMEEIILEIMIEEVEEATGKEIAKGDSG
jgi:hypothetical protein